MIDIFGRKSIKLLSDEIDELDRQLETYKKEKGRLEHITETVRQENRVLLENNDKYVQQIKKLRKEIRELKNANKK